MFVVGIPIRGKHLTHSVFKSKLFTDKVLFNGGKFGFEGGICTTLVLILSIIVISNLIRKKLKEDSILW